MARIVFTVTNDLTHDQRMHRICTSLSGEGHDVLLVGRRMQGSLPLEHRPFRQKRLNAWWQRGKMFYVAYNFRLFFFLLLRKTDVICGIDLDTILPCYLAAWLRRKRCVYDAHELFPEVPEVARRANIQRIWRAVESFAIRRIPNGYTVSQTIAEYFKTRYGRSYAVIANMPWAPEASPPPLVASQIIIYQGALNEGRGLEALIQALPGSGFQLVLAGEGDLSGTLRKLVNDLGLHSQVTFAGKIKPADLKQLTQSACFGLNLLDSTSLNYYYSLANKFFDYVQAGIPQVCMNFPEYRRMNRQFEVALLVDDLQPETITRALAQMDPAKDFYFSLRQNCLLARKVWTWKQEEQKLLSFYRQLK